MDKNDKALDALVLLRDALAGTPFMVKYVSLDDGLNDRYVVDVQLYILSQDIQQQPVPAEKMSNEGFVDAILQTGEELLQQNGEQAPRKRGRKPTLHATLHVEPAQPSVKPHPPMPRRVTAPKPPTVEPEEDIDPFLDDE